MLKKRFVESLILFCAIPLLLLGMTDTKESHGIHIHSVKTSIEKNRRYSFIRGDLTKDILEISKNTIPTVTKENIIEETAKKEASHTTSGAGKNQAQSEDVNETEEKASQAPKAAPPEPVFEPYQMYTNSYTDMKEAADEASPSMTTLDPNTSLTVVEETGDWRAIQLDETSRGYIKAQSLSESETAISALNRWGIELTPEETDLLAAIVFLEAGIDSMVGKEAVVETIFNRVSFSNSFPGDIYSVLSQRGQFSTWPLLDSAAPGSDEYQAIHNVVYGATYILDSDYVYFSRRKANGHDFIKIGKHWFGRE